MVALLVSLFIFIGTTFYPEADWNRVIARATTCILKKGMTEEQVNSLLGYTIYGFHQSSLGGFWIYETYRLRLDFSYTGDGLRSAHFTRYEVTGPKEGRFRYFEELPLPD
jgi:hypothetical protein